jgi:hypothetical protein
LEFTCGVMVVLMASPGFFPSMDVAEVVGVCCCHLVECVAGLGFNWAKAFTDNPVGGNGDGAPKRRFPVRGTIAELPAPLHQVFEVKTLPFGRATTAPLALHPCWRHRLLRPASACDSGNGGVSLILCRWSCVEDPWVLVVLG